MFEVLNRTLLISNRILIETINKNRKMKQENRVNSHNEWGLLNEVIVGRLENAMFPSWNLINAASIPTGAKQKISELFKRAGQKYPTEVINAANEELDNFISILINEGAEIRRPDIFDFSKSFSTPDWQIKNGFCCANPRDVFLVLGNQIIEAPMADRTRYFESWPYRPLLREYFLKGAKWVSAPKPQLIENQFNFDYQEAGSYENKSYVINEFEPTFDAADFLRCGKDLFVQKSHVTNQIGIEWLERYLGNEYKIHIIETKCLQPLHIDTTLCFLGPGKLLINPEFINQSKLPSIFKKWDIFEAPKPISYFTKNTKIKVVSDWMSMNMLMLDEQRIIVESKQEPMIRFLKSKGFKPIPCSFENYYTFGGSFHCATLDINRDSKLVSYF